MRQIGEVFAKGFADDFVRLIQVFAGINQITGRLHGFGTTNAAQYGGHRIRMVEHVFGSVQVRAGKQWLGKCAGPCQRIYLHRHGVDRGVHGKA